MWYQWMLCRLCKIWIWMRPESQILISSNQHQLAGQLYNSAILTVLSMLTFYIIASALRLAHISILYPVCCLTVWPGRDNVIEFDQQSDWAWWELRKTLSQTWNIRREGGRWENGAESFPGYSNWEGIRMPLLSLLTPPTTIKKLKPKLFFVIQDETM